MNDYATESGDVGFAKEKWDSISKAYQFLRSTYDPQAFLKIRHRSRLGGGGTVAASGNRVLP